MRKRANGRARVVMSMGHEGMHQGAQVEQPVEDDVVSPASAVCVTEDDEAIRTALRALLEDEGYRVLEAEDGLAGYELLRSSASPLVALIDHKLPKMDGCDLLDLAAKDEGLRRRHEFIFVTASPRRAEDDCGEALEELNVPVIPKPFDIDEVLEPVAAAAQRLSQRP
jgi:CheY-like chemotaxis protein